VPDPTIRTILRGTVLENGRGDAEALARAVLAAITRRSAQANKRKQTDEAFHRRYVELGGFPYYLNRKMRQYGRSS
jgi:hypothetical protein